MLHRRVDLIYKTFPSLVGSKFFTRGWGDLHLVKDFNVKGKSPDEMQTMAKKTIGSELPNIVWREEKKNSYFTLKSGSFESPLKHILPLESASANFKMIVPHKFAHQKCPMVILLAPTGDHGYIRRQYFLSVPLAKRGIGSIILENPYYGQRKPPEQFRSFLRQVSDLLCMGAAIVGETNALIQWMKQEGQYGPFALSGISMGGLMASYAGTLTTEPVAIVPCVSPISALPIFSTGGFADQVDWNALKGQEYENTQEKVQDLLDLTDLHNYPKPTIPEACIWVNSLHDAYIAPDHVEKFIHRWNGSEVRWLPAGHVSAQLFYYNHFVNAIKDSLERLRIIQNSPIF